MLIAEAARIPRTLAFEAQEYEQRLLKVRNEIAERGLDANIFHVPENLAYLTGYQTPGYYFPQALIVSRDGEMRLLTRYLEQTGAYAFSILKPEHLHAFLDHEDPYVSIVQAIREMGLENSRIGFESECYSSFPIELYKRVVAELPGASFENGSWIAEKFRKTKSPAEIEIIRKSCEMSDAGMQTALDFAQPGMNEHELSAEIHRTMISMGGEYTGLPLFLSSGDRTFIRHAVPQDRIMQNGETILIEVTGVHWRYAGPLFRTISLGKPSDELRAHSDVANEMLEALISAIKPGATSHEVHSAAVRAADKSGIAAGIKKRSGYSIGLNFPPDWGEGVFLDLKEGDETVMEPGMVFHMPQAMRIGDSVPTTVSETVMVTETGCEVLTKFGKRDLLVKD